MIPSRCSGSRTSSRSPQRDSTTRPASLRWWMERWRCASKARTWTPRRGCARHGSRSIVTNCPNRCSKWAPPWRASRCRWPSSTKPTPSLANVSLSTPGSPDSDRRAASASSFLISWSSPGAIGATPSKGSAPRRRRKPSRTTASTLIASERPPSPGSIRPTPHPRYVTRSVRRWPTPRRRRAGVASPKPPAGAPRLSLASRKPTPPEPCSTARSSLRPMPTTASGDCVPSRRCRSYQATRPAPCPHSTQ